MTRREARHAAAEEVVAGPRSVDQIDRDLDVERAIWLMERRGGDTCPEAKASRAQLDRLLDERIGAVSEPSIP